MILEDDQKEPLFSRLLLFNVTKPKQVVKLHVITEISSLSMKNVAIPISSNIAFVFTVTQSEYTLILKEFSALVTPTPTSRVEDNWLGQR